MSAWLLASLWQISLQTAVLAALIWIVARLSANAPARLRFAMWVLVLAKFFVPPFAYLPSSLAFWQRSSQSSAAVAGVAGRPALVTYSDILAGAWMLGVAAMAVAILLRHRRQRSVVRDSTPAGEELNERLVRAAERMGMRRLPHLRITERASTPALVGLLTPTILLSPAVAKSCSPGEMEAMLAHELAHIKRRDMLVLWIHKFAQVLFFFHPVVWLLAREFAVERELACDELVLSCSEISPREYAAGYVAALKLANGMPAIAPSMGMAEPREIEERRLTAILRSSAPRLSASRAVALLVITVIGLPTFAGVKMGESPRPASALSPAPKAAPVGQTAPNSGVAAEPQVQSRFVQSVNSSRHRTPTNSSNAAAGRRAPVSVRPGRTGPDESPALPLAQDKPRTRAVNNPVQAEANSTTVQNLPQQAPAADQHQQRFVPQDSQLYQQRVSTQLINMTPRPGRSDTQSAQPSATQTTQR